VPGFSAIRGKDTVKKSGRRVVGITSPPTGGEDVCEERCLLWGREGN
jgi:hypothetical protein